MTNPFRAPPLVVSSHDAPPKWWPALARAEAALFEREFDQVVFGPSYWLTNTAAALRLPDEWVPDPEHTMPGGSTWDTTLRDAKPVNAVMAGHDPVRERELVQVGDAWINEVYLWLAVELYGPLEWRGGHALDPVWGFVPGSDEPTVAIMPIHIDEIRDVRPWTPGAA